METHAFGFGLLANAGRAKAISYQIIPPHNLPLKEEGDIASVAWLKAGPKIDRE